MRTLLLVALAAGTAAPAVAAPVPKAAAPKTPAELLIGTWELVTSTPAPPPGLTAALEFTAAGVLNITVAENGKPTNKTRSGKYTFAEGRLKVVFEDKNGPKDDDTMQVKDVTADKLVLVEGQTKTHEFKRVPPAK